eukprot:5648091-Lingulodinium_polyedra.AAC.1
MPLLSPSVPTKRKPRWQRRGKRVPKNGRYCAPNLNHCVPARNLRLWSVATRQLGLPNAVA